MRTSNHSKDFRISPLAASITAARRGGAAIGSALLLGTLAVPIAAVAQDEPSHRGATAILLEEVIVTARKREETLQDAPLSVSAFNADQIDALKVRSFNDLSVGMPNVALDEIGTTRGTQNFSIRGLGVNSSIPSIDPAVGIFVNGIYMGVNNGMVFDTFDLESIQVLRGPQGTLFGRNTTGGAVLVSTKKPGEEFEMTVRAAMDGNPNGDGGLNKYLMGAVSGPVTDTLGARLVLYKNNDDGYFINLYDGSQHGKASTRMIRPTLEWAPSDTVDLTLRWEHVESDNDGPSAQGHTLGNGTPGTFTNFSRDSFDFSIDEPGYANSETDFVSVEANFDVAFGDGQITYLFGWRDYSGESLGDIDASPVFLFHAPSGLEDEQTSHELRYNGRFDNLNVTAGVFQFSKDMLYAEGRLLPFTAGGTSWNGGGDYSVDTKSVFLALDFDINEQLTLTAGANYSEEDKDAKVASLSVNIRSITAPSTWCNVVAGTCAYDFVDSESWDAFGPKLGFRYALSDDTNIYGHWTRGFRSGGYNLRNTSFDLVNLGPGPFDQETVDSYELGFKSDLGARGNISGAIFLTEVEDMQRELNYQGPAGVIQVIKNTADTEILGFELDATLALAPSTLLKASYGYTDPEYKTVLYDINHDGVLDSGDKSLTLPRAAKNTYSIGITNDLELGDWGSLTSRLSYAYRDKSFYTDDNLGYINDQEILDAGVDFYSNSGHWVFSIYGSNLLDAVKHGGDTQLSFGQTFSPLAKGRVVGVDVTYNM